MSDRRPEEIENIIKAASKAGLAMRRLELLSRLPPEVAGRLPVHQLPSDQLRGDVLALSELEARGTLPSPLELWLERAAILAEPHPSAGILWGCIKTHPNESRSLDGVPLSPEPVRLLMDNWLFQDAAKVLEQGPSDRMTAMITSHGLRSEIPSSAVDILSLLDLLTAIVIRDELHVEEEWTRAWIRRPSLGQLLQSEIVRPTAFKQLDALPQVRGQLVQRICHTEHLTRIQAENAQSWAESRTVRHNLHSMIMWGGAGYLARATLMSLPYRGHPSRMAFFKETIFRSKVRRPDADAGALVREWLKEKRAELLKSVEPLPSFAHPPLVLPAFAFAVIAECTHPDQLLGVALEMRARYAPLRRWLSAFNLARRDANPMMLKAHRDLLNETWSGARYLVEKTTIGVKTAVATDSVGINSPHGKPLRCRAALQELLLQPAGDTHLDRLLALFGLKAGTLRIAVEAHLREQWTAVG